MLSNLIKRVVQNVMLSSSPDSRMGEMNHAQPEDPDFAGISPDGHTPAERARSVLAAMNPDEKLLLITGYKALGIPPLPRFGLPAVWMSDATSGPRSYGPTTAFPAAVAMAASWNPRLVAESAAHIAEAARAKGVSILLGPGVNIARIPTCGRNFEYMGEDPYLAGILAAAYVRSCAEWGVICTVKHMAVNNSEYDRHKISSDLDERTLREIYLPAFEAAVKFGGALGIMSAYNPVNGVWASENRHLLTQILRREWGFDGMVVSDWNSLYSTAGPLKSGLDIEMPKARWLTPEKVKAALAAGEAAEEDLDRMAGNLLRTLFSAGVYDRPVKDPTAREFHPDHENTALSAAREGLVLLKNSGGALPLPEGKGITIAVCGPLSEHSAVMGGGSCNIARTTGTVNLLDGIRAAAADGTRVVHVPAGRFGPDRRGRAILSSADAVVLACGFDYMSESELYDRPWRLPGRQRRLIRLVSRLNTRSVAVITAGGDVETASWLEGVPALVHGLYLGQTVGTATAELLFGRINPSGKLPFTMARRWNDIAAVRGYPRRYWTTSPGRLAAGQGNPRFRRMRHWHYTEGLMVGYRHFDTAGVKPAFPFGFGLSYTTFLIDRMRLSSSVIGPEDSLMVTVRVTNTGGRRGAEVVQVYVSDPESRLPRPVKELKGFVKIDLEAGESADADVLLDSRAFRYWDPDASCGSAVTAAAEGTGNTGCWVAEDGEFLILAGNSSGNISARDKVVLRHT